MRNPFSSRRDDTPAPPPPPTEVVAPTRLSADGWDPVKMREMVFTTLATRVGPDLATGLREDFANHLASDPINGVEAGWVCLTGKLVDTIDKFNDLLEGARNGSKPRSPGSSSEEEDPVSPFMTFRKDG